MERLQVVFSILYCVHSRALSVLLPKTGVFAVSDFESHGREGTETRWHVIIL